MEPRKPGRLTLPDRQQRFRPKATGELNTAPLPAVPPRLVRRSLQFRRTTLVPYSGAVEVISRDLAELIKHREKVANLETMRLQALVVEQDRTRIRTPLPSMQPVDTPPLTPAQPMHTPPSQVAQGAVQSQRRRRVDQIDFKNVFKHVLTDPLYRNSLFIMASALILGGFGFVFWIIIARLYKPENVGIATTLISLLTLLSSFTILGLNVSLNRYLPKSAHKNELINSSFVIVTLVSLLASGIFLLGLQIFSPQLLFLRSNPFYLISFTIFVIFCSWNILVDSIFMAFRAAVNILIKNSIISTVKLVLPFALIALGAYGIFVSAASALALGVLIGLMILLLHFKIRPSMSVNVSMLKETSVYSFANYLVTFMIYVPSLILPVIILNVLSAKYAAYYYVASMIQNFLLVIPLATTQALLTEGSYNEAELKRHIKKANTIILAILLPATAIIVFGGNIMLQFFGKTYATEAFQFLQLYSISTIFTALLLIANAIMNVKHQIKSLVILNVVAAVLTLWLSYAFISGKLVGIGWGWILGQAVAGFVSLFFIIRNLYIE